MHLLMALQKTAGLLDVLLNGAVPSTTPGAPTVSPDPPAQSARKLRPTAPQRLISGKQPERGAVADAGHPGIER